MEPLTVLMVGEKPSIAQAVSKLLGEGRVQTKGGKGTPVHEWSGRFMGMPANYKMTSVIGHVYSLDFTDAFQNRSSVDPSTLFAATTIKKEANPKARIPSHLKRESKSSHILVLWLDCDRVRCHL